MNGIEILAQNTIYETECNGWIFIIFVIVGFAIGLCIAFYNWINYRFEASNITLIILTTLIGVLIGAIGYDISEHETDTIDHIEYKVIVADDVNSADFMDKYEILDQEGKIYTVKEKE